MYQKPELRTFGTLRELTLIGLNQDCDGGIFGIGDGDWWFCDDDDGSGRS